MSSSSTTSPTSVTSDDEPSELDIDDAVSRRHALRTAGIMAAGALAGGTALVASAGPAAAASGSFDGNPAVTAVGSPAVQADTTSTTQTAINAVANYSDSIGVRAFAISANSYGVYGSGTNAGVWGRAWTGGTDGVRGDAITGGLYGVRGLGSNSAVGVKGESSNIAVHGVANSSGTGIWGESSISPAVRGSASSSGRGGLFESATGVGLEATGGSIGIITSGTYSAALLSATSVAPPNASSHYYEAGEITQGPGGVLWYCVASGTPGTWRTLSAPTAAGAFYAVTPSRAYDSRVGTYPQNGSLGGSQNRTLSVANSYDAYGVLLTTNFVPAGATAVMANITIVETVGSGFLTVNPGGVTTANSSTINWSTSGQILANGIALTLNGSRQVTVVNGSAGSTQFLIDIVGYWL